MHTLLQHVPLRGSEGADAHPLLDPEAHIPGRTYSAVVIITFGTLVHWCLDWIKLSLIVTFCLSSLIMVKVNKAN